MPDITRFEKLQQVIAQALTNPIFAEELRVKAAEAQSAGVGTDEWEALVSPFARNPTELAALRMLRSPERGIACTPTTSYILNAGSTVVCTLTTTTTTTSFFCPQAETTSKAKSKRKSR
jgi:hypothetical protein